jgi:leader peptidase (prepilin peptidase) / N-methyltransferase
MPAELPPVVVGAVLTAALCALGPTVVGRLPEPAPESAPPSKPPYAAIASRRHLAIQLAGLGALVGGLLGAALGAQPVLAAWVYVGGVGVVLAYVDARTRLLPTRIIAPSYAVVGALVCAAAAIDADPDRLGRAALGWLTMGGFYLLLWLAYPKGLGYGDVRLAGLLGLALGYLGWASLVGGLYCGFLFGAVAGGLVAFKRRQRGRRLPFGPFMLVGSLAGVLFGPALSSLYVSR